MTTDTLIQLGQIRSGQYNDWHPLLHTYYLKALSAQPFGIQLAAWIQAGLFAAVVSACLTALEGLRPPPAARAVAILLFLLQPLHAIYAVTLWKDIPFSLAVLVLVALFVRMAWSRGAWLGGWKNPAILAVTLVAVALLRHNGLITAALAMLSLFLFFPRRWKRLALVLLAAAALTGAFKAHAVRRSAEPLPFPAFQYLSFHHFSAVAAQSGTITDKQWAFLEGIHHREYWVKQYSPYDGTALVTVNSLALMKTNARELRKIWFEVAMANKALLARHTLKAASILWKFTPPENSYFFCYYDGITENDLGLKSETKLPRLRPLVNEFGYRLLEPGLSWIFFRPALPLYLILFLVLLTALRHRSPLLLLPLMPLLGHAAGLFISCPVQDTRYFYPILLSLPLIALSCLLPERPPAAPPEPPVESRRRWKGPFFRPGHPRGF
ncbi:MAG: hypothetical protein J0L75_19400 [Spirochaetes bacterium]|nr:hypothetical protein [Spirochaetota bacterium]